MHFAFVLLPLHSFLYTFCVFSISVTPYPDSRAVALYARVMPPQWSLYRRRDLIHTLRW